MINSEINSFDWSFHTADYFHVAAADQQNDMDDMMTFKAQVAANSSSSVRYHELAAAVRYISTDVINDIEPFLMMMTMTSLIECVQVKDMQKERDDHHQKYVFFRESLSEITVGKKPTSFHHQ